MAPSSPIPGRPTEGCIPASYQDIALAIPQIRQNQMAL